MSREAVAVINSVSVPSEQPNVAAVFNLDDKNEHRIRNAIQIFYTHCDRLRGIRLGTAKGVRMVWTLGTFTPACPPARVEWSVLHWAIDETSVRVQRCKDEAEARAAFETAGQPAPQWPGIKFPKGG